MGIVMLPRVLLTTSVESAIATMRRAKRGGVVLVRRNGEYHLLYAGDLSRAQPAKIETVAGIRKRRPVLRVDSRQALSFGVDLVDPWRTEQQYYKLFDRRKVDFLVALLADEGVAIVTRHELQ